MVPKIAIAPLLMLWFGFGVLPKLIIAFLVTFFPMLISTLQGLEAVEPEILDVVRSLHGTRWQAYAKIRLPNSLPYVFSGMKVSTTLAVVGALVAEFLASDVGLGFLVNYGSYRGLPTLAFAGTSVLAVIGIIFFLIVTWMERLLLPWYTLRRETAEKDAAR
jgi:NitT/TauT family transport system permease protein